jgi:hypothetical protein
MPVPVTGLGTPLFSFLAFLRRALFPSPRLASAALQSSRLPQRSRPVPVILSRTETVPVPPQASSALAKVIGAFHAPTIFQ